MSASPGWSHQAKWLWRTVYPFGPLPGCAAMITLLSYDGTCCVGLNTDTLAITDPGGLADDLQAGLKEVVALQG